jgi:hypothetical protein
MKGGGTALSTATDSRMTMEGLEDAIVRHIGRHLAGGQVAHVLCHEAYYCRHVEPVIRKHFPTLEFGGPVEELPWLAANRSKEPVGSFRLLMVGSIGGMCLLYLCARLSSAAEASQLERAIALVVNYDADQMGRTLCRIVDSLENPRISLHVDEFLSVYKDTTHVNVDFPPVTPRWDFEADRPVY